MFKYYEDNKREDLTDYDRNKKLDLERYFFRNNSIHNAVIKFTVYYKGTANIKVYYSDEKNLKNITRLRTNKHEYIRTGIEYSISLNGFSWDIDYNKNLRKKGDEYEKFIAQLYINNGFKISYNGLKYGTKYGTKDNGVDLVAYKNSKTYLIQCKNWSTASEYKLNHSLLKEFIGNCYIYMKRRNMLNNNVIFHFISSNKIDLDKSAKYFLKYNKDIMKFKHIEFTLK